jgi:hypothetical protein
MSINQNVPACVAAGKQQRLSSERGVREQQPYSSAGSSDYNALQVSFVQRPAPWGHLPRVLHVLEVDEQPRRGVLLFAHRFRSI